MYEQRLVVRRRCIERLVEASNRVDELTRDGIYDENTRRQSQAVAMVAGEAWTLTQRVNAEIVALLSREQYERLEAMCSGRVE